MDVFKKLAKELVGKIKTQDLLDINFSEKSFRRLVVKNYNRSDLRIDEHGNLCVITIKVNSDLGFSINNPNRLFRPGKSSSIEGLFYKVYFSSEVFTAEQENDFNTFFDVFKSLFNKLKLSEDESIFCYGNTIMFVLNFNRNIVAVIDEVTDLLIMNGQVFRGVQPPRIFLKNIPEKLRPLLPLVKKYIAFQMIQYGKI